MIQTRAAMLVLVVGPSGAGKDSLLAGSRAEFAGDAGIHFVRRVITRPPDPGGEPHEPVTEAAFLTREFALSWSAHGLRYGIPANALAAARVVVANVSRTVIAEAAARHRSRVIEVTAPDDVLTARLAARGREGPHDVARRLERRVAIPDGVIVDRVMNDSTLDEAIARFIAVLRRIITDNQ